MSFALVTAPRLIRDVLLLTPDLPIFGAAERTCKHTYITNVHRSRLPDPGQHPTSCEEWMVEGTCRQCRCHFRLVLDLTASTAPCPTRDYLLHHFRIEEEPISYDRSQSFTFHCKSPSCKAQIVMEVRAPILSSHQIILITGNAALQARWETARQSRQETGSDDSFPAHTPAAALDTFRSYLRDSLYDNKAGTKKIPTRNKRFMLALGDDANNLLKWLGFTYEPPNEGAKWAAWCLPRTESTSQRLQTTALADVWDELLMLLCQRPAAELAQADIKTDQLQPLGPDLERILGCLDYQTTPPYTRSTRFPDSILDSYKEIGALSDFADELVAFAFDRNHIWNPDKRPILLQHLKDIASFRRSELLETKVVTLQSQGYLAQSDIENAYQYFQLHPDRMLLYSDEHILNIYRSTLSDLGLEGQIKAKEALHIIGQARSSMILQNAAADRVETYDEALSFLGAERGTPDDFILSLYTAKTGESSSNQQIAQKALAIIADERQSDNLKYQSREDTVRDKMSLQQAWNILAITEPEQVDDEMVSVAHGVALSEDPGRADELNAALMVVADARNSFRLKNYLSDNKSLVSSQIIGPVQWKDVPLDEPRGLKNIGNTCYLNTLLQYLFAIRPLRELLKNFDQYKQDLDETDKPFNKQIAGIKASKEDVRTAHQFVQELAKLFDDLAVSRDTFATPSLDLARLTIREPHKSFQRRMTVTGSSVPAIDAVKPPLNLERSPIEFSSTAPEPLSDDIQQEATRIFAQSAPPAITCKSDDEPPQAGLSHTQSVQQPDEDAMDTTEVESPKDITPQASNTAVNAPGASDNEPFGPAIGPTEDTTPNLSHIEAWARQQDMAEALDNTIRQLQCAIKPEYVDEDGNQHDLVSRLFWGKEYETDVKPSTEVAKPIDFKDFIIRVNDNPTDLVDSLDDTKFGKDEHSDDFYTYYRIAKIPSIVHIRVSRGNYDREKGTMVRNTNRLILRPVLYLDRYMADDEMTAKRKASWEYKATLSQWKGLLERLRGTEPGASMAQTLRGTMDHLRYLNENAEDLGLDVDLEDISLAEAMSIEASDVDAKVESLQADVSAMEEKLSCVFPVGGELAYRLQAIFVHLGHTVNAGHWVIYIHDAKKDQWRKYNDEDVSLLSLEDVKREVLEPGQNERGVSAYVSYAREGEQDDIFDVVFRQPEEEPVAAMEVSHWSSDTTPFSRPASNVDGRPIWDDTPAVADNRAKW